MASHTEGNTCEALGNYSHAEGYYTQALGNNSHTEGYSTLTLSSCSHSEGYDNLSGCKGYFYSNIIVAENKIILSNITNPEW